METLPLCYLFALKHTRRQNMSFYVGFIGFNVRKASTRGFLPR